MENGCHDNHVLDVATDCQPQMQEKKLNTNGFSMGRNVGEDSNQWQVIKGLGKTRQINEWMSKNITS